MRWLSLEKFQVAIFVGFLVAASMILFRIDWGFQIEPIWKGVIIGLLVGMAGRYLRKAFKK